MSKTHNLVLYNGLPSDFYCNGRRFSAVRPREDDPFSGAWYEIEKGSYVKGVFRTTYVKTLLREHGFDDPLGYIPEEIKSRYGRNATVTTAS